MPRSRACSICTRWGVGLPGTSTRSARSPRPRDAGRPRRRPAVGPPRAAAAEVDEVYSPTWSPDGTRSRSRRSPAGSAISRSCELADGRLRRLTADTYADLQPAWSPGRHVDRVHDRSIHDRSVVSCATARTASACSTPARGRIVRRRRRGHSIISIRSGTVTARCSSSAIPSGVPNVFRLDLASAARVAGHQRHDRRGRRHAGQPRAVGRPRHRRDRVQRVPEQRVRGPPARSAVAGCSGRSARGSPAIRACRGRPWTLTVASQPVPPLPTLAAQRDQGRLSPAAVARRHRVAVSFGGRRTARQLRVGRRLDAVRRSARRPSAADRRPHQQQAGRIGVRRDVRQPQLALELGREHRADAGLARPHHRRRARSDARARRDAHARADAVDEPAARRVCGVSDQPVAPGRDSAAHVRELGFSRDLRTEQVSTRSGMVFAAETRAARQRAVDRHRRGRTGAGRRLRHLRRDAPLRRQPLPAAGDRQRRRPATTRACSPTTADT